ncbi:MAG: hypothetical protein GY754_23115 [bacterium]|nr:hypothetical protein [bacterium]
MELLHQFTGEFLSIPEEFNKRAEAVPPGNFMLVSYSASVSSPSGNGYGDAEKIAGLHFSLTIILEPIGESAAVENRVVSFVVCEDSFCSIVFDDFQDAEQKNIADKKLSGENCAEMLCLIKDFCEEALPEELEFPEGPGY